MKNLLRFESLLLLVLATYLYRQTGLSWGLFAAVFLLPDLGLLGYLVSPAAGAAFYNTLHHQGLAVALYLAGIATSQEWLQATGTVMLAHSAFDRVLGFGLKYKDGFHHTHLGFIGKNKEA
jgi:hypothetical protein